MAIASPLFRGIWTQVSEQVTIDEQAFPKINANTRQVLTRIVQREQITRIYQKTTDAEDTEVNGDQLALEDINTPQSGYMYNSKIVTLNVKYNVETGIAVAQKQLREEEDRWHKVRDLDPIMADGVQTG